MRIISYKRLRDFAAHHPDARAALDDWYDVAAAATWGDIQEVRRAFPHADAVAVASGKTATVFNVKGNRYRLITAVKYRWGVVYVLRVLTHAEYTKGAWKKQL